IKVWTRSLSTLELSSNALLKKSLLDASPNGFRDAAPNNDPVGAGPSGPPPDAPPDGLCDVPPNIDLAGAGPDGLGDAPLPNSSPPDASLDSLGDLVHLWGFKQQQLEGELSRWELVQSEESPYQVGGSISRTRSINSERLMPSWRG
ncbi:hypothetical protein QBC46DRAFT_273057, partial [Diplogelasinospora grovesii]